MCPWVQALGIFCRAKRSKLVSEWTQAMKSGCHQYFLCTTARMASNYLSPTSLLDQGRLAFFTNLGYT